MHPCILSWGTAPPCHVTQVRRFQDKPYHTEMAKVTIVTTVFNGSRYVRDCINSVLPQSYQDYEMIVLDDGSTDGTVDVLRQVNHPRIHLHYEPRRGRAKALNLAVKRSSSDYVAILDSDDLMLANRLKLQVAYLDSHPKVGLVGYRNTMIIDEHGELLQVGTLPGTRDELRSALSWGNPFSHSGVMFRRKLFDRIKGYDERLSCSFDRDLYIRLSPDCEMASLPGAGCKHRCHGAQYFEHMRWGQKIGSQILVQCRAVKYLGVPLTSILIPLLWPLASRLPASIKNELRTACTYLLTPRHRHTPSQRVLDYHQPSRARPRES